MFANCVSRPARHTFSCVAERHLSGCISPEDLFTRGGRCARGLPGHAERRACKANLSRGVPLAVRYTADIVNRSGKWSKRLPEPCQRNRITSTGRPRLSESPPQWRRGFNATLLEISSNAIEPPLRGFKLISTWPFNFLILFRNRKFTERTILLKYLKI